MQSYDLIMLAIMAAAVLFGAWKGLAWQVASLAAIFVSYFVALEFRTPLANMIQVQPPLNQFIAMFAIYALASLAIWIGFGYVRSFIEKFYLRGFDRQAGALLGALKGGLLCIVVTLFAVTLLGETRRMEICQSKSGLLIARSINQLRGVMPKEIHPLLAPYLNKFNDVMNQTNPDYAQQPNLPNLGSGQGTGISKAVEQYVGRIFTTDQPSSGQEFQGTVQGMTWPQQTTGIFPEFNNSNIEPASKHLDLGSVRDIFNQVTNSR